MRDGDLILDPFVGTGTRLRILNLIAANSTLYFLTGAREIWSNNVRWRIVLPGSLLIAAAHFGGYTFGTDIDYLTVHGKSKPSRAKEKQRRPDERIEANMKQYDLLQRYLDVVVCDASRPVWRRNIQFDSIITDRKLHSSSQIERHLMRHLYSPIWDQRTDWEDRQQEKQYGSWRNVGRSLSCQDSVCAGWYLQGPAQFRRWQIDPQRAFGVLGAHHQVSGYFKRNFVQLLIVT